MADQYTRQVLQVVRGTGSGAGISYNFAPALGGAGIAGVVLTTGNGAWGAYADLAAAKAITTEFWVCGMHVYTPNQIQHWQLQLFDATLTQTLANFAADVTAVTVNLVPMYVPIPIYRAANTQIQGRAGGAANGKTINAYLIYVLGL